MPCVRQGSSHLSFVFNTFNLIDLFAILPWYLEHTPYGGNLDALRVLRVLRLFRLLRYMPTRDAATMCTRRRGTCHGTCAEARALPT